ncbi:MAG: hypothetical protein A2Y77_01025 [Planctomycetes bacterium RBG_13_62_9]|nr:MAG: hypothetical protein A2Y77_01025 [Planctomycetes bacterium RBG_13_62_9]
MPVLWMVLLFWSYPHRAPADEASDREYKIKAAFVYNFMKFVEGGRFGPADGKARANADPNQTIRVGVLGTAPAKDAFVELTGKLVKDRPVRVYRFKGLAELKDEDGKVPQQHPALEEIRKCHVLFICPSERPCLLRILPDLQRDGILTVGDVPDFLEAGGIINLLVEDKKVRFEINLAAAARAKLQIRSSLLRLAARTVEHDQLERQNDDGKQTGSDKP